MTVLYMPGEVDTQNQPSDPLQEINGLYENSYIHQSFLHEPLLLFEGEQLRMFQQNSIIFDTTRIDPTLKFDV